MIYHPTVCEKHFKHSFDDWFWKNGWDIGVDRFIRGESSSLYVQNVFHWAMEGGLFRREGSLRQIRCDISDTQSLCLEPRQKP